MLFIAGVIGMFPFFYFNSLYCRT